VVGDPAVDHIAQVGDADDEIVHADDFFIQIESAPHAPEGLKSRPGDSAAERPSALLNNFIRNTQLFASYLLDI
jgi:hypothetical protein